MTARRLRHVTFAAEKVIVPFIIQLGTAISSTFAEFELSKAN